jgi:hypothetical protein
MCPLEAQDREDVGNSESENYLYTSKDIPSHEDVAIVVGKSERDAEIDHGKGKVQANLKHHWQNLLLVLSDVPEDASVFDSQAKAGDHEDDG